MGLQLDEEEELSTSPYMSKGRTWQQAVQFMEEIEVERGFTLPVVAKHDTYGISFEVNDMEIDRGELSSGVPLYDPTWKVSHNQVRQWNDQIVSNCAQDPSTYREVADMAVQIGARPSDY